MFSEEKFRVRAPIQRVWEFMIDLEEIGSCIPGCERIEAVGENACRFTITIKLPIFSITGRLTTTLTEIAPPCHLKSVTDGEYDIGGGTFRQESVVELEEISHDEVEVSFSADTRLEGLLAGFSEKIMSEVTKVLGEQFTKNIQKKLEGEQKG